MDNKLKIKERKININRWNDKSKEIEKDKMSERKRERNG